MEAVDAVVAAAAALYLFQFVCFCNFHLFEEDCCSAGSR